MANTYTQLYIQFVFAVQNRISLIKPEWEQQLHKYITGIVQNNKHKMIAINGMEDHIHLFVGFHTTQSIADLMQAVKGKSSEWINDRIFVKGHFTWQEGYGAFSVNASQTAGVVRYIENQKAHHANKSFEDEFMEFLTKYGVAYDPSHVLG